MSNAGRAHEGARTRETTTAEFAKSPGPCCPRTHGKRPQQKSGIPTLRDFSASHAPDFGVSHAPDFSISHAPDFTGRIPSLRAGVGAARGRWWNVDSFPPFSPPHNVPPTPMPPAAAGCGQPPRPADSPPPLILLVQTGTRATAAAPGSPPPSEGVFGEIGSEQTGSRPPFRPSRRSHPPTHPLQARARPAGVP